MTKPKFYRPHWPYQRRNEAWCNETVYDRWRIDVVGHQCQFKIKMMIDGVGFCGIHAKRYSVPAEGG